LVELCALTEDGVYYHIKNLRNIGVLVRHGGRKDGYWEVKETE